MTTPTEYPFHSGAKTALNVAAVLCMILIIAIPVGIWMLVRVAGAKVTLHAKGLTARGLGTLNVDFADVQRFGLLRVPIIARGIGGALARKKVGGDEALHLCFMTKAGKTRNFIVSQYERHDEIVAEVGRQLQMQPETVNMGVFGPKWPKIAA
jgi:hypothetical protein